MIIVCKISIRLFICNSVPYIAITLVDLKGRELYFGLE